MKDYMTNDLGNLKNKRIVKNDGKVLKIVIIGTILAAMLFTLTGCSLYDEEVQKNNNKVLEFSQTESNITREYKITSLYVLENNQKDFYICDKNVKRTDIVNGYGYSYRYGYGYDVMTGEYGYHYGYFWGPTVESKTIWQYNDIETDKEIASDDNMFGYKVTDIENLFTKEELTELRDRVTYDEFKKMVNKKINLDYKEEIEKNTNSESNLTGKNSKFNNKGQVYSDEFIKEKSILVSKAKNYEKKIKA